MGQMVTLIELYGGRSEHFLAVFCLTAHVELPYRSARS